MNLMSDQMTLWVINVLIHSTVLTASLLLVATMFRRRAAMRYWILCCGLLLVLGSPVISAAIQSRGGSWIALAAPNESPSVPASAKPQVVDQVETNFAALAESNSTEQALEIDLTRQPKDESALEADAPAVVALPPIAPQPAPSEVTEPRSLKQWLSAIVAVASLVWLIGAALLLLRMSIGWFRLSRILKLAEPIEDAGFQAAFARACSAVGCDDHRAPKLVASDEISGPLAAGLGGSYVVLPKHLLAKADPSELADVLVHEVAHVVRRDQIVVLVQNLVSAIYWPHPLVRKLNQELAKAREEVCDNFVLASTDAPVYSRTLLSLAQLVQRPETMPGSVGFFASRWKLENRVAGLLDEARDRTTILSLRGWTFVSVSMLTLLTAISLGTLTIATAQNADPQVTAMSDPEAIVIDGIVRGPDGAPIAGARVIAIENFRANTAWTTESKILEETTSDKAGRYSMSVRPNSTRFSNGMYLEAKHLSVLATLAGYGPDEQNVSNGDAPTDLKLATAQRIMSGQVVDLEGQPIEGVRVRLQEIRQPPSAMDRTEVIDQWVTAAKANPAVLEQGFGSDPFGGGSPSPPHVVYYPDAERMLGITTLGIETQTDHEGRFELPAIGDDRLAILRVDGTGIASSMVPVVAREIPAVNTPHIGPIYRTGKTFGCRFQITAEPSQLLQGVITDRHSGKPIRGATISIYQLPRNLLSIDGFLSTTSDDEGEYVLSGLPRNTNQSGDSIRIRVSPPSDQPYFRCTQSVPVKDGLQPIPFDIPLTRGIWATGRITEAGSGEPVTGLVAYHPRLDNPNAADHEAFNPNITTMGYEEMFATELDGTFRIPALRGKGILRAVATNDDQYQLVAVPGTTMEEPGMIRPSARKIYHNIMPGNGVVSLDVDDQASIVDTEIQLTRVPSLTVDVVEPNGKPATGFRVAGRRLTNRMTMSGRGYRYWEDGTSQTSTFKVMLGDDRERERPLILLDEARKLGAVVWLNTVDGVESKLTVPLQPTARIVGSLIGGNEDPFERAFLKAGMGDAREVNQMFQSKGGAQMKVSKDLPFGISGTSNVDEDGRFELTIPAGDRCTVLLMNFPGDPLLLDNKAIPPGGTLDLGTIDLRADLNTWPEPRIVNHSRDEQMTCRIAGKVSDTDGNAIPNAAVAVIANREQGRSSWVTVTLAEGTSDADGKFELQIPNDDDLLGPTLIVRDRNTAAETVDLDLKTIQDNYSVELQPEEIVRIRLVDLEGQTAAGLGLDWRMFSHCETRPTAAPPKLLADANGVVTIKHVAAGQGCWLEIPGSDRFAPQTLSINSGEREERSKSDATYRPVVKNVPPDRTVTIPLATSQKFAGRVLLGDSDQPAVNTPISIWSSQQEFGGSMITIESRTDDQGRFELNPYPGVRFGIQVYPNAAVPYQTVQVEDLRWDSSEKTSAMTIRLPQGAIARGTVIDDESGKPIVGAYVQYLSAAKNPNDTSGFIEGWQTQQQTDAEGRFQVPALPGVGTLLVHAGVDQPYVLKMKGSREVALGKPGGTRYYAHAFEQIDLSKDGNEDSPPTIKLTRSRPLKLRVLDPDGERIANARYTTALLVGPTDTHYRADSAAIVSGEAIIHGLAAGDERQIHVWCKDKKMGAVATLSGDRRSQTITLEPAGNASLRLIDSVGDPIAGRGLSLEYVLTEGRSDSEPDASKEKLSADIEFRDNFDRNRRPGDARDETDDQGRLQISNLIPGVTYQLAYLIDDEYTTKRFTVKPGQSLDLGDVVVDRRDD